MNRLDDEAAMRDINHPEHSSGWREAGMAFLAICIGGWIFFSVFDVTWLPFFVKFLLTIIVAAASGYFFIWWIGGHAGRERIANSMDRRDRDDAETLRKIEEAKAKGDFDRFG
ncbi:MAG: hypothetical protein R8L07_14820 [Alphaproteobacteria bacterium]|nr:hypothetical protein [Alphaproteobacteria bacterium]